MLCSPVILAEKAGEFALYFADVTGMDGQIGEIIVLVWFGI